MKQMKSYLKIGLGIIFLLALALWFGSQRLQAQDTKKNQDVEVSIKTTDKDGNVHSFHKKYKSEKEMQEDKDLQAFNRKYMDHPVFPGPPHPPGPPMAGGQGFHAFAPNMDHDSMRVWIDKQMTMADEQMGEAMQQMHQQMMQFRQQMQNFDIDSMREAMKGMRPHVYHFDNGNGFAMQFPKQDKGNYQFYYNTFHGYGVGDLDEGAKANFKAVPLGNEKLALQDFSMQIKDEGLFTLSGTLPDKGSVELNVYDETGKSQMEAKIKPDGKDFEYTLNLESLKKGKYVLQLKQGKDTANKLLRIQ